MTLDARTIDRLTRQLVLKQPLGRLTFEQSEYVKAVKKDLEDIKKKGWIPDWTQEVPDLSDTSDLPEDERL